MQYFLKLFARTSQNSVKTKFNFAEGRKSEVRRRQQCENTTSAKALQKVKRPTCGAQLVHFSRSALRVERWLVRYPLPSSVFTLLAALSQLFLQTP
jgi:hypothetical protein